MNGNISTSTAPHLKPVSVPVYIAGIGMGIVILLTLFEPLISGGLNLPLRFLFFFSHIAPALPFAWVFTGWLHNLPLTRRLPSWWLLAIAGWVTGIVLAPWSVFLELLFGVSDDLTVTSPFETGFFWSELLLELWIVPLKTTTIWVLINLAIIWRLHVKTEAIPALEKLSTTLDGDNTPADTFFSRIPARFGRDVIYMEAQEHYLRVVLVGGEELLLYGLANAVRELAAHGFDGMQVHRSYWINWAHVRRLMVNSNGGFCELESGLRIPVSRRRAAAVQAAFDDYQSQRRAA
jgi:hypothetical protein